MTVTYLSGLYPYVSISTDTAKYCKKNCLHDNDMISCPSDKWLWYLHQVGSVPMDDCTKRHATLPWRCHVYDVRIPIAVRLLLAPLLQGLHLGPHDVKSSLCMWQLSPSFCGYTLFLQWYSYTLKSHTYPGLKKGFTGNSSTLLTLSINSTSENESTFNSIQASPLPLYKNILEHILVVNDTQATEQIKFMGCWNISQHNSHSLFGAGI